MTPFEQFALLMLHGLLVIAVYEMFNFLWGRFKK